MGRAVVIVGVCGAVAGVVAAVFVLVLVDNRSRPEIVIEDPVADATIVVAVEGAVASPGVYALPGEARVQDAIAAAGGTTGAADLAAINLAARLRDEDRLVVPTLVPTARSGPADGTAAIVPPSPTRDAAAPLDLNTATAAELETLPGIGLVLAERIVAYRTEHGPFRTVEELANVRGISPEMVDELRPRLTV